ARHSCLSIFSIYAQWTGANACPTLIKSQTVTFAVRHEGCVPCYDCGWTTGSMKITPRLLLLLFFIVNGGFAQGIGLRLADGSGQPFSTISLDLTLTSDQPRVAAAQWTLTYWPADVTGIDVA